MELEALVAKLKAIPQLKDFVWSEIDEDIDSVHAYMPVTPKHFRDEDNNELMLGDRYSIYVAHMYKDNPENEFVYIKIYRLGDQRYFRKWYFHKIEYNYNFLSGRTVQEVVKNVEGLFNEGYSFI